MKENPEIDELLNSYIDGELTGRQQTEVQRLIAHDAEVAKRLRQLKRCKMLVSSLPVAEAPEGMLEDIKASLERRALLVERPSDFDQRAGARHLLARKVMAAAAMIGLVAVLGAVVYIIVAPETVPQKPVAIEEPKLPGEIEVVRPRPSIVAIEFNGSLELRTSDLVAVDAFINSAIEDNGLSGPISPARQQDKSVYSLSCSQEGLNLLLVDLGSIWDKFDSATLFVETEVFGRQIEVEAVTAEQITEIVNQDSLQRRTEVAKDFALLNDTAGRLPGRQIVAGIDEVSRSLMTIPKPVMTGSQRTTKRPARQAEDKQNVHLAIVVVGSE